MLLFWPVSTITLELEKITGTQLCQLLARYFSSEKNVQIISKHNSQDKYAWRYSLKCSSSGKKRGTESSSSPSSEIDLANGGEYHSRKACKAWINYCNICSKAGLICCTLHLVLLPLVSWGVVTEFTLVWGNFLPINWMSVVSGLIFTWGNVKPLPGCLCCWVEKRMKKKGEGERLKAFFSFHVCLLYCNCYTLKALLNFTGCLCAECFF